MKSLTIFLDVHSAVRSKAAFIVCFIALAATLSSCSPSEDKAVAAQAVEEFHQRYNNRLFSDIHENAEPGLKNLRPREDFLASIKAMREGQGAVLEAKELDSAYKYSFEGNMVKLLYEVTYEKGKAKEEFIWTISNGKGKLRRFRFIPR
jgi:hypothetical protein